MAQSRSSFPGFFCASDLSAASGWGSSSFSPASSASVFEAPAYLGLIPTEHSSGAGGQRLGHISKQGNPFLRGLLVEAAQSAVRCEPRMRREYQRWAQRKCRALAKVAMARQLAVRLYWMLRSEVDYTQLLQGSPARQLASSRGRS